MATNKKTAEKTIVIDSAKYGRFAPGDKLLIRTVTHYHLGTLREVHADVLVLDGGGWVADTKRFSETLTTGAINEFERAPDFFQVGRGAIVDAFPWANDIPTKTI